MISSESPPAIQDTGLLIVPGAKSVWRASAMALFLPTLVIAVGYAGLWAYLLLSGREAGALARASQAVLILGVPLLLVHAGLRLATTEMILRGSQLEIHPGFPARDPVHIAYRDIGTIRLRRGLSGRLTGSGSLILEVPAGRPVVVCALQEPEAALAAIRSRCSREEPPARAVEERL
ncbi:PH domain-containing protein [Hoeflea marina]|nr:PH domain-containing protein [Hoeflea marina]